MHNKLKVKFLQEEKSKIVFRNKQREIAKQIVKSKK